MSTWSRLRALSWIEWRTLVIAVILLPLVELALILWGFRRVYFWMDRLSPDINPVDIGQSFDPASQMAEMVNIAARRGLRKVTCLRRSLLLWWLLRWQRTTSDLCIGVRKDEREFQAHAWVELNGVVINDRADIGEHFAVFEQNRSLRGVTWI